MLVQHLAYAGVMDRLSTSLCCESSLIVFFSLKDFQNRLPPVKRVLADSYNVYFIHLSAWLTQCFMNHFLVGLDPFPAGKLFQLVLLLILFPWDVLYLHFLHEAH